MIPINTMKPVNMYKRLKSIPTPPYLSGAPRKLKITVCFPESLRPTHGISYAHTPFVGSSHLIV